MNKFNLKDCMAGKRCRTISGKEATFIMLGVSPMPLTMLVGGIMESYTLNGNAKTGNRKDDLMMDDFGIESPTSPLYNVSNFQAAKAIEEKINNGTFDTPKSFRYYPDQFLGSDIL